MAKKIPLQRFSKQELVREIANANALIAGMEDKIKGLHKRNTNLQNEIDDANKKIDDLEQQVNDLESKIDNLEDAKIKIESGIRKGGVDKINTGTGYVQYECSGSIDTTELMESLDNAVKKRNVRQIIGILDNA